MEDKTLIKVERDENEYILVYITNTNGIHKEWISEDEYQKREIDLIIDMLSFYPPESI